MLIGLKSSMQLLNVLEFQCENLSYDIRLLHIQTSLCLCTVRLERSQLAWEIESVKKKSGYMRLRSERHIFSQKYSYNLFVVISFICTLLLNGMSTPPRFSAMFTKGNHFRNFLLLNGEPNPSKKGILVFVKERICSSRSQFERICSSRSKFFPLLNR